MGERLIPTDCKSVAERLSQVQILPCAPISQSSQVGRQESAKLLRFGSIPKSGSIMSKWWNGRHSCLKSNRVRARKGSSPFFGTNIRGVAQVGRALGLGPRGHRFESCYLDQFRIDG